MILVLSCVDLGVSGLIVPLRVCCYVLVSEAGLFVWLDLLFIRFVCCFLMRVYCMFMVSCVILLIRVLWLFCVVR